MTGSQQSACPPKIFSSPCSLGLGLSEEAKADFPPAIAKVPKSSLGALIVQPAYQNCRPHLQRTGLASGYCTLTTWWQSGAGHHFNSRLHCRKQNRLLLAQKKAENKNWHSLTVFNLGRGGGYCREGRDRLCQLWKPY